MTEHGGKREGAGRKPKAEEIELIKMMDSVLDSVEVWKKLAEKINKGDVLAAKVWLQYRFGMPKQLIDMTTDGKPIVKLVNG